MTDQATQDAQTLPDHRPAVAGQVERSVRPHVVPVTLCTCGIRPWLHKDNYQALVDYVQTQAERKDVQPNVVSITRLGA